MPSYLVNDFLRQIVISNMCFLDGCLRSNQIKWVLQLHFCYLFNHCLSVPPPLPTLQIERNKITLTSESKKTQPNSPNGLGYLLLQRLGQFSTLTLLLIKISFTASHCLFACCKLHNNISYTPVVKMLFSFSRSERLREGSLLLLLQHCTHRVESNSSNSDSK